MARVRKAAGEHLFEADGGTGAIRFDPASRCLIVALPQPEQIALSLTLQQWKATD